MTVVKTNCTIRGPGTPVPTEKPVSEAPVGPDVPSMSWLKDDLLDWAMGAGIAIPERATKAEILAAIHAVDGDGEGEG